VTKQSPRSFKVPWRLLRFARNDTFSRICQGTLQQPYVKGDRSKSAVRILDIPIQDTCRRILSTSPGELDVPHGK
jgi:hypothetical protein